MSATSPMTVAAMTGPTPKTLVRVPLGELTVRASSYQAVRLLE